MAEPIYLNMVRAEKAQDCRLVSPLEVLKQLVADIESGKREAPDQIYVAMLTFEADNKEDWHHCYVAAGAGKRDLLSLLEMSKYRLLREVL
jgi:hypothetical protein